MNILTVFRRELPPMAGRIPLKAGHSVNPLLRKEGRKNSPLLRGVDSNPKGMRRRGVLKIILNARLVSVEKFLSLRSRRILTITWQSGGSCQRHSFGALTPRISLNAVGLAVSQLGSSQQ